MGNTMQKPQQKEGEEVEEDPNFTCEICIEPMLASKRFKNSNRCVHLFCLDCIAKYIEIKIEDHTTNIECPGLNCKHPLDPLTCRPLISKPLFDKWCDLLCDLAVLQAERCYCPYRDCSTLVLNECGDKLKKSNCPNCKKNFCFRCKIPWHAGYGCNESGQLRNQNDILFGVLVENNKWTRCYKCGQSVERVSGCSIITCRCGAHFCHRCGGRAHLGPCRCRRCDGVVCSIIFLWLLICAYYHFILH